MHRCGAGRPRDRAVRAPADLPAAATAVPAVARRPRRPPPARRTRPIRSPPSPAETIRMSNLPRAPPPVAMRIAAAAAGINRTGNAAVPDGNSAAAPWSDAGASGSSTQLRPLALPSPQRLAQPPTPARPGANAEDRAPAGWTRVGRRRCQGGAGTVSGTGEAAAARRPACSRRGCRTAGLIGSRRGGHDQRGLRRHEPHLHRRGSSATHTLAAQHPRPRATQKHAGGRSARARTRRETGRRATASPSSRSARTLTPDVVTRFTIRP